MADDGLLGYHSALALLGSPRSGDRRPLDDQRRSAVARAALSRLVATRAGIDPAAVTLDHDEHGRPLIEGSALAVSIAHAAEFVACAVSERAVGVDLERTDRPEADAALAKRFCTPAERRQLDNLPVDERQQALVRLWTRKEAVAKALGLGVAIPFEQLDVSANHPVIEGVKKPSLRIADLTAGPSNYTIAIATKSRRPNIQAQLFTKGQATRMHIKP